MAMRRKLTRRSAPQIRGILCAAALGVMTSATPRLVLASTDSWNSTVGGNWSQGLNWTGGVPTAGQDVWITNAFAGSQTITFDSGAGLTYNSLTLDATGGGTNVFLMAANNLNIAGSSETVGLLGLAFFNQTGGTNTITNQNLYLGYNSGATGNYTLGSGASLLAGNSFEYVGYSGVGNFNQTGGTNTVTSFALEVGYNSGSTGTYTLGAGASLLANSSFEIVGQHGLGTFNQTGGTNTITNGNLYLGTNSGSTGTYTLGSGASLLASNSFELVGQFGLGNFSQTGGTNTITGAELSIGNSAGSTGTYTLGSGASLLASNSTEYVGYSGLGNFNQTGGNNTITGYSLFVGYQSGGTGTYTLSGGSLIANNSNSFEFVGYMGVGNFNQTGGTNTITGAGLIVGDGSGVTGNYTLASGASLLASNSKEIVGFFGVGNFIQTGGTHTITNNYLDLGDQSGSTGTYTLGSGASLLASNSSEYVGSFGLGVFNQTGGTNTIINNSLILGNYSGSTGNYTLGSGASLVASNSYEYVGYNGLGNFNQTGGTNTMIGKSLYLGYNSGSSGNYTLGGGSLIASNSNSYEYVGYSGLGNFNQTGGANTMTNAWLYVGYLSGSTGNYTLGSGASLLASNSGEYVGNSGLGNFNQTGGTNTITNFPLYLGINSGSTGNYTMSGGSLNLASNSYEAIGYVGLGNFDQTGGTNTITSQSLYLGFISGSTGTYTLSGGTFSAPSVYVGGSGSPGGLGILAVSGGQFTVTGTLQTYNTVGSIVNLTGGTINAGALNFAGGLSQFNWTSGTLDITSNTVFDSAAASTSAAGLFGSSLTLGAQQTLMVTGNETLGGTGPFSLTLNNGATNSATGSITLSPTGTLILNPGSSLSYNTFIQAGGTVSNTFTNNGTYTYQSGQFLGQLINQGTANFNANFSASNGMVNNGTANVPFGVTAAFNGSGLTNNSIIQLAGGTISTAATVNSGLISGFGTFSGTGGMTNNSVITQSGGNLVYSNTGGLNNNGTINLANGLQLQIAGSNLSNDGTVNLGGGTITGAFQLINNSDGVVSGPGNITATFLNSGTLEVPNGITKAGSFTNNGVIEMAGAAANLGPGATITNSAIIEGFGKISDAITNNATIQPIGGTLNITGALTNSASGLLATTTGDNLLISSGLATNAGTISLTGGTFDNDGQPLTNTFQVTGYGIFRTGGFFNNGSTTFTGGTTTVNGPVTNNTGETINIKYQPAIFTGNVNNLGTIKTTNTTVTFTGNYTGNAYTSDPSDNIFQANVTVNPGGNMTGGAGDRYFMSGGTLTNNGTFTNTGLLQTSDPINNAGIFTQTGTLISSNNFTNSGTTTIGGTQTWTSGTTFTNTAGTSTFTSDTGSATNGPLAFSVTGGLLTITAPQQIASVSITAGKLDVNNTSLTINYGSGSSPNAAIRNYISSAYNVNGALWTGTTGITSSNAKANPGHSSIGFADGADGVVTNLPAGVSPALPNGGMLPAGLELVTSAFPGDANLDGKVDFTDFVAISTHFLANDINWDHGNFNYDGAVDFNDFVILSTNFGDGVTGGDGTGATAAELAQFNALATSYGISKAQISAWDATISTLPEPTSAGLLAVGAIGLLQRRQRAGARPE
jgi:hypothetical protein